MNLFSKCQYRRLIKNALLQNSERDNWPVVKLTLPGTHCVWLLTELDLFSGTAFYGLCDDGKGNPELGYVTLEELSTSCTRTGNKVKQVEKFEPAFPLNTYAEAARVHGYYIEAPNLVSLYV